jgi:hypothetical protein
MLGMVFSNVDEAEQFTQNDIDASSTFIGLNQTKPTQYCSIPKDIYSLALGRGVSKFRFPWNGVYLGAGFF